MSSILLVKNGIGQPHSKYMHVHQEYVKEKMSTSELEMHTRQKRRDLSHYPVP